VIINRRLEKQTGVHRSRFHREWKKTRGGLEGKILNNFTIVLIIRINDRIEVFRENEKMLRGKTRSDFIVCIGISDTENSERVKAPQ